jgi:hypothetical protein
VARLPESVSVICGSGAFASIDQALAAVVIPIVNPPLPQMTLTLSGSLATLVEAPLDHLRGTLAASAATDATSAKHPSSRGVVLTEAASPGDPFFASPRLQIGVRLALLNGLLHALWDSGLLDLDPQPPTLPAKVTALLPPIVRPARAGEAWDLVVSVGELELTTQGADSGTFGVRLEAGVSIDVTGGALALKVAEEPTLEVWEIHAPPQGALYNVDLMRILLHDVVWKQLRAGLTQSLAFQLPIPSLGALQAAAPSLAGLQFGIAQAHPPTARAGYLVLDVDWTAKLP